MIRHLMRTNDFQIVNYGPKFVKSGGLMMPHRPSLPPENDQMNEGVSDIVNTAGNALESETTHRENYDMYKTPQP